MERDRASRPSREEVHASPALQTLLRSLGRTRARSVLDLGPATGANFAFFSAFASHLAIADLRQLLVTLSPADRGRGGSGGLFGELGRMVERGPFDLLLCWDLLDYLTPGELRELGGLLSAASRHGTLLFALVSTRNRMPAQPRLFEVQPDASLHYQAQTDASLPVPGLKETHLTRSLPGFLVEISFLLRNGIQEFVLAYDRRQREGTALAPGRRHGAPR